MSFVHCHSCNWEQDDFWSWRYNPVRFFFTQDVPTWIKPEMVNLRRSYGGSVFSWYVLFDQFRKWCRRVWTQKWWTYSAYRAAVDAGHGGCPVCGASLCID